MDDPFRELTDVNLFEGSKSISSYNSDSGSRMCYGLKLSAYKKNGENLCYFMIGRSREFSSTIKEHAEASGLKYKNSDIVSSANIFLTNECEFIANGSYSPRNKRWTRFTSGIKLDKNPFKVEVLAFDGKQSFFDPFSLDDALVEETDKIQKYKGVMLNVGCRINKKIQVKGGLTFGDKNINLIKHNIGISYKNECSTVEASIERTNYKGGDLKPETSFKIVLHLKNIGI